MINSFPEHDMDLSFLRLDVDLVLSAIDMPPVDWTLSRHDFDVVLSEIDMPPILIPVSDLT